MTSKALPARVLALVFVTASVTAAAAAPVPPAPSLSLDLDRALALARERAPLLAAARLRIDEARGQVAGALPALAANPVLSGGLGRRFGDGSPSSTEGHVELAQPLELGGQRRARLAGAHAAVDAATAGAEATTHALEADVARAYFRALAARARAEVAATATTLAERAEKALERRHQLGDVPVLEVNVARTARARAFAQSRAAEGTRLAAEGDLRRLLGLGAEPALTLAGDLADRRRYQLPALLARAADRADLRAVLAEASTADAEVALGRAARWPGLSIGAAYERDDRADVVMGVVSVELPVFARGQRARAEAAARARRLRLEAETGRQAALTAVRTAHAVFAEHERAAAALGEVVPLARENEELARKSYEAGQLSLAEWLLVRREALETRFAHLDELLAAAEAGVAVAESAGVSP